MNEGWMKELLVVFSSIQLLLARHINLLAMILTAVLRAKTARNNPIELRTRESRITKYPYPSPQSLYFHPLQTHAVIPGTHRHGHEAHDIHA